MNLIGRTAGIVALSALLTGCGAIGGGCSGIEMDTQLGRFGQTDVTLRNTSDEPKLVTLAVVDQDGAEIHSQTMHVGPRDFTETDAGTMSEDLRIDISCE